MILDTNLLFSNNQAITVDAASSSVIDLGADRDLGVSDIDVFILVTTTFDSGSDTGTLDITLETDSADSFGSPAILYDTGVIAQATLVAGYIPFKIKLPQVTERYLRLGYNNATEAFTAGKITAGLITGRQNWRAYDAVTGV